MLKIIKHSKKHKGTCPRCGCVYSFRDSDKDWIKFGTGGSYVYYILTCPECKHNSKFNPDGTLYERDD